MFTGVYPFKEKDIAGLLYAQVHTIPPHPDSLSRDLPSKLCDIIMKLLEKSPDDRFNSCQELYAELRKIPFSKAGETQFDDTAEYNNLAGETGKLAAATLAGKRESTSAPGIPSEERLRVHSGGRMFMAAAPV